MQRVCVTGGAGFIGSHVVDRLVREPGEVVVLDNLSTGFKGNVSPRAAFVPMDLSKAPVRDIAAAIRGAGTVWHFATNCSIRAMESNRTVHFEQNVLATSRLLEACADSGVGQFILASSSAVYGLACARRPRESSGPLLPISTYGALKLAAEGFVSAYCVGYGLAGGIFRLANVVGPRQRSGIIGDLLRQRGEPAVRVLGDGSQVKSYVHVSDAVDGMLLASRHVRKGAAEVWNVASDDRISVRKVAELVRRRAGFRSVSYAGGRTWTGDIPAMGLNIRKLKSLGWQPKMRSLAAVERAVGELSSGAQGAGR